MSIKHNLPRPDVVFGTGIGPIPHYPNWAYHCPKCNNIWEIDVRFSDGFIEICPDCHKKEIPL